VASIAYIGNFGPPHSTENDVLRTLTDMGHDVTRYQENEIGEWERLVEALREEGPLPDLILWTSTHDYAEKVGHEIQRHMQWLARIQGVPTMGFHLDRWWGLQRWKRVLSQPFFRCDYVLTADGGHQAEFGAADVNHHWSPPAIAPHNCVRGEYRPEFDFDIVFVGSWQGGYHEEWQHRPQLIKHLQRKWGDRVAFFPGARQGAIRGQGLADLYASAKVVVGDSCLVPKSDGSPMTHYCSDRVFETIGRGGLLLHPFVPGVLGTMDTDLVQGGVHALGWDLGHWDQLDSLITYYLDEPTAAEDIRRTGYLHVWANHTYANRLDWALGLVGL
jgi:hypothetical protein